MTDVGPLGSDAEVALRVRGVSKAYGPARVLDDVSFEVRRGRVHALLGCNGSGKSTLIKVLAGIEPAEGGGTLDVGDEVVAADAMTPARARALGFRFVHQHPAAFLDLTVAENIALEHGYPVGRLGRIARRDLLADAATILERHGLEVAPDERMGHLRPAHRTLVAIARALEGDDDPAEAVLVLDEPTASLPEAEARELLDRLVARRDAGQTIVYVSHRLDEVLELADDVTVLRDGRHVETRPVEGLDERELIGLVIGREVDPPERPGRGAPHGEVVLTCEGVAGGPLRGVDLELRSGEIVGIAGLLGSGRTELLEMVFGARPRRGRVRVGDREVASGSPAEAVAAGVAFVPEDRLGHAAFVDLSVTVNHSAATLDRYFRFPAIRRSRERTDAAAAVERFGIRVPALDASLGRLSGGNQQKVVLARWLAGDPKVLLLDEPTQGVDVGSRADIWGIVGQAADEGMAVVVVSSDLDELAQVADRVLILSGGRLRDELRGPELTGARCTELAYRLPEGVG